jgi:hypothetical protein
MKRIFSGIMALSLLLCFTSVSAAAPGSSSDPLVSKSYMTSVFSQSLNTQWQGAAGKKLGSVFTDNIIKLQNLTDGYLQRFKEYDGYTLTKSFRHFSMADADAVNLVTGATFILLSGNASLNIVSGTVIDITSGNIVPDRTSLSSGSRYFCAEDTQINIKASGSVSCLIDGYYKLGDIPPAELPFVDVPDDAWYRNAVSLVYSKKLFNGTSDTEFSPYDNMTRGMFVTALYRLAGSPSVAGSSPFTDVSDKNSYYYYPVLWATSNNVITGNGDGTFSPDDNISRQDMAVVMYRYAKLKGYDLSFTETAFSSFPDKGEVAFYASDAVKWATYKQLINGSDGHLLPLGLAQRCQVAQIIANFCDKIM